MVRTGLVLAALALGGCASGFSLTDRTTADPPSSTGAGSAQRLEVEIPAWLSAGTPVTAADFAPGPAEADPAGFDCEERDRACLEFAGYEEPSSLPRRGGKRTLVEIGDVALLLDPYELERERRCLAMAAYAEARSEGDVGMLAVMWVIINRVREAKEPVGPCEIVAAPAVLEAIGRPAYAPQRRAIRAGLVPRHVATSDDSPADREAYRRAKILAYLLTAGRIAEDPTASATHYWSPAAQKALGRKPPRWREHFVKTAEIGAHHFFRPPVLEASLSGSDAARSVR